MSHFGLGGRGGGGGGGSPLDGEPGLSIPSSISHAGRGRGGLDRAATMLEAGEGEVTVEGSVLVVLCLKGLSKASFIFFTLIWPNPGRFCSLSDGALAMLAKLYRENS